MMEDVGSELLDLIRRIQAHDQQAFGLLYDRLAPLVNAVIQRIVGDTAEAEEVLMETFWQVCHGADHNSPHRATPARTFP